MKLRLAAAGLMVACTSAVPAPEPEMVMTSALPATAPAAPAATAPSGTGGGTPRAASTPGAESPPTVLPSRRGDLRVRNVGDTTIRVLLTATSSAARVSSPSGLTITTRAGSFIGRSGGSEAWRIEHDGRRVRAIRPDGVASVWSNEGIVAHAMGSGLISVGGKPYRGDLTFYGVDSAVVVVNVLRIDEYLRGVVPLEIGTQADADSAAVQAQAVTARSFAFTKLNDDPNRVYDLTSGVQDQVYGGAAVETGVASEAVESTRTLVLKYNGRIVNAPYSSTCGGSTAAASEVWREGDSPYLQPVSDRIPGTDRYYCDQAPRFRWTRIFDGPTINAAINQYLAAYTSVPGRKPGAVRDIAVASRTPSGRNGIITITTERGNFTVRGNDMRSVLRAPGGELLNSTAFTVETTHAADGSIGKLTLRGSGWGHGVGMCQSGAIGRARAGQDFRTILHTYYPGTTVAPPG